jgi:hypothetical protein
VRENGPTLPNLPSYPDRVPGSTPRWPAENRHNRSTSHVNPATLAASLGVNVALLIGLVIVLVLGHFGLLSPGGSSSGPSTSAPAAALSPTAVSSPTPTTGSLQVSPSSVTLGCDNGQQTQVVVLVNTGTAPVQWQVTFSLPANSAGVEVDPNQGTMRPGTSIAIQIRNRTRDSGSQGVATQQGAIQFNPVNSATPGAGPSPSVTYTAMGCNG